MKEELDVRPPGATRLTATFKAFFDSEKSGGFLLIACTALSLLLANSPLGGGYVELWHVEVGGLSIEHWINDGLMTVFFLLIGLELEREFYIGELSDRRNALLPIVAAGGGVVVPGLIHFALNAGTETRAGVGIPMATDIAFALGILALLGDRVPSSLKVFLAALAVIDDLIAIILIAVFYTAEISSGYLVGAFAVFSALIVLNRLRIEALLPYMLGGVAMWFLMSRSGVHATITGVLLAFAIPFAAHRGTGSPSHRLEHALHKPVAFLVLPAFALANTAVVLAGDALGMLLTRNSLGIAAGLAIGKPLGITLASLAAVRAGLCRLPGDLGWRHVLGAGILGGIGFTMSIFITNLAFPEDASLIMSSKLAIFAASLAAGVVGWWFLGRIGRADRDRYEADPAGSAPG
jgi:NhaA family Na+:H+ antiporter